jgi:hypothetical protein
MVGRLRFSGMASRAPSPLKRILSFLPSALRSFEACERHYLEVHRPWAVNALGAHERLLGYSTTRLEAQWSADGAFGRRPHEWRYASLRFRPPELEFDAVTARLIAEDHLNFLRDLRRFDVDEGIAFERPSGQLTSAKYVVLLDRPDLGVDRRSAGEQLVAALVTLLDEAYGARRLVVNRVLRERENVAIREPGQQPTGRVLPASDRVMMLELYFDDSDWGDRFFASPPLVELVGASGFSPSALSAYRATELVGHAR